MTRLHTTTVRYDTDTWADLVAEANRLGISKAAYIREATQARIERSRSDPAIAQFDARIAELEHLVGVLLRRHQLR